MAPTTRATSGTETFERFTSHHPESLGVDLGWWNTHRIQGLVDCIHEAGWPTNEVASCDRVTRNVLAQNPFIQKAHFTGPVGWWLLEDIDNCELQPRLHRINSRAAGAVVQITVGKEDRTGSRILSIGKSLEHAQQWRYSDAPTNQHHRCDGVVIQRE